MQAKDIQLAMRSGVRSSVAWSLNALTALTFNANPPLLLTQHPGLLDALLQAWHSSLAAGSCVQSVHTFNLTSIAISH